ncbi:Gfo/Idh/MocA family protein [Parendozoicomonas haliclonae]|uniref:1,5-anhydro-D-fructose reductase n=1 Tax=Parendozoicomonas haliclonae TaxID=1960125 RepID=A0A1X7AP85_9GAMM|nr:Gfo/Idh/MocA family oxidoreductase [Parendozoicomonas haliclonae]SMA49918.1 1,5-anhydro-D-fructose reductase [Parendozoicomonas haliclonae]
MSEKLQWAILGTSFISGVMAEAIIAEGRGQIYGVAARNTETLNAFADQYGIAVRTTDFEALIHDDKVDVVYIGLPTHLHHQYTELAAQAGKAIVCEKSLSVDMEKTDAALAAAAHHKVFFAEGLMYLHHPFTAKIAELIQQGAIGGIRAISGHYCADIAQFANPQSGGTLFNLGCYPTSLAHLLLQQQFGSQVFDNIQITALGRRDAHGNLDETAMTARLNNGVMLQLHTAEDYGLDHGFTILGTTGILRCISNPWLPGADNILHLTPYEQPTEEIRVTADGDAFLYQVRNVTDAIRAGQLELERPAARHQDSRQIMSLLTQWQAAAG